VGLPQPFAVLGPYKLLVAEFRKKSPFLPIFASGELVPFHIVFPPAGPWGPVAPLIPFFPAGPVNPMGPLGPVAPVAPLGPAGPCGPTVEVAAEMLPKLKGPVTIRKRKRIFFIEGIIGSEQRISEATHNLSQCNFVYVKNGSDSVAIFLNSAPHHHAGTSSERTISSRG
jgi:hypothetical protein